MEKRLNGAVLGVEVNGKPVKASRKSRKAAVKQVRRWYSRLSARWGTTVAMGIGIPALSLAMSCIGGRLLQEGHIVLGCGGMGLCGVVLAVSLSHLAWAIGDITGSSRGQSWAMAVAVDATLVLGELALVHGFDSALVPVVMGAVALMSAWLNVWAFLAKR